MAINSTAYKEPQWANRPPSLLWKLIEIKGGVEVAKHDLSNRATSILGRAVNQVHIPLHHESISRQHARISFDAQGNPWLRDLQSAHGTFVNKRRLPAAAVGKAESNSRQTGARGIRLFVGDILAFGASSRYFSLEGPPPQPSEKEKLIAKVCGPQENRSTTSLVDSGAPKATEPGLHPRKDEGVSWGIDMTDSEDAYGNTSDRKILGPVGTTSSKFTQLDPQDVPEKYRKELEKLNAMKYKLSNLETEGTRIRRKGDNLTEGQQKQLERIADREAILRKSIQEREERLQEKLNGISAGRSSKRKKTKINPYESIHEDEDDDFFDRTKETTTENATEETESEETLTLKWNKCLDDHKNLTKTTLQNTNGRVNTLRKQLKLMLESNNEEAFFVKNDLQLALESKKKVESAISKNNIMMDEIERLLKIVNPKIHCDRTLGYIGEEPATTRLAPPEAPETIKQEQTDTSMPPPRLMPKESERIIPGSQLKMPSPNKRKRNSDSVVTQPNKHSPSPSLSSDVSRGNQPVSSVRKESRKGTLSFLDHSATSKVNNVTKTIEFNGDKFRGERSEKPSYLKASLDSTTKNDVWRAPEGQDGSGRTKLNEKFAGRY